MLPVGVSTAAGPIVGLGSSFFIFGYAAPGAECKPRLRALAGACLPRQRRLDRGTQRNHYRRVVRYRRLQGLAVLVVFLQSIQIGYDVARKHITPLTVKGDGVGNAERGVNMGEKPTRLISIAASSMLPSF